MVQLHKKFVVSQVKELIERYLKKQIESAYIQQILGIAKTRFFALLKKYRQNPQSFSIEYHRTGKTRGISKAAEKHIMQELIADKKLIEDKDTPLRRYNYSFIKTRLEETFHQNVSVNTIINRARKHGFYMPRPKPACHDREVLTHQVGELIQHDSSIHKWSPYVNEKWNLITSLDDYSRCILYAQLVPHESSWAHIAALESVFLTYGLPFSYYVDSHSIFRFVRGRDELHYQHHLLTDQANPQWKQVLDICRVKVIYALSPQAKGKIERPYGWIQDRLVRLCARENVKNIRHARIILAREIYRYNHRQIHSTTGEIPHFRFQKACHEKLSLFRQFVITPPFLSTKDIFCLRLNRTADGYRNISINNVDLKVNGIDPYETVCLHIYPLNAQISEVRFWLNDKLIDIQKLNNSMFKTVHF